MNDRRRGARFGAPLLSRVHATVRPGNPAVLVNLSAGGVLLRTRRPLRPGGRVHVQLGSGAQAIRGFADVLRCGVAAIDTATGVTYLGALRFDHPCVVPWEALTRHG